MKKVISLILVLCMALCLSIPAFAEDTYQGGNNSSYEGEVRVEIDSSAAPEDTYFVRISWNSLTFTYSFGNELVWDAENHKYTFAGEAGWDKTDANITVINHSNVSVQVDAEFTESNTNNGTVEVTLTNDSFVLAAPEVAEEGQTTIAPSGKIKVSISGAPEEGTTEGFKVGTVRVSITKAVTPAP